MLFLMLQGEFTRRLPRGPHDLPRAVVERSQRARLVEAMAACVAARGYEAVTVADVVSAAGVSRRTFYEHFEGKRECFLAAYDTIDLVVGFVEEQAGSPDVDPRTRLREGIRTYLDLMTAAPDFARAFTIDVFAAGPEALERRVRVIRRFADLLAGIAAEQERAPRPETLIAVVGGINELVVDKIRQDAAEEIPDLLPAALELAESVCF